MTPAERVNQRVPAKPPAGPEVITGAGAKANALVGTVPKITLSGKAALTHIYSDLLASIVHYLQPTVYR